MLTLRQNPRRTETEELKAKVDEFGQPSYNPVRDQIAELRRERDAGRLSMSDYALTVAELLGAGESVL